MSRPVLVLLPFVALVLAAQAPQSAPLRAGVPLPVELDLVSIDPAGLIPRDNRDAAQVEGARQHWWPLIAGLRDATAVRLRLPLGEIRVPLLLAAAQATASASA